jgi:cytochrome c556
MLRTMFSVLAIAASGEVALAAATGAEAIKERREIIKANGEATKPLIPMLRDEAPFDLGRFRML